MYFLLKLLHLDLKVDLSSPCELETISVAPVFFQNMRRGPQSNKFKPIQHAYKEISFFVIYVVKMRFLIILYTNQSLLIKIILKYS